MDSGELLGDDLIIEMVAERLAEPDARARGFILDGCPRTTHQAEAVAALLIAGRHSTSPSTSRSPPSRPCVAWPVAGCAPTAGPTTRCRTPPKVNWTCDVCGGEVIQREDDTEDAIGRRLELYERQTAPLIEWYESAGPAGQGQRGGVARRRAAPDHPSRRGRGGAGGGSDETKRRRDRQDAPGGAGRGRDARGHPGGGQARGHHRRARRRGPGGPRPPGRQVQLPPLPGVPGRDLHVAQRHDRPRHPRRRTPSKRATSCRSTAGRSSRATTATPPSPWPSGR